MKKFLWFLIPFGLLFSGVALATPNTTVPLSPGFGYVLLGNVNGSYTPVATSTLGISGGSGSPGGSNTQLQYNNSGNFGGISQLTWNGTLLQNTATSTLATTTITGLTVNGASTFNQTVTVGANTIFGSAAGDSLTMNGASGYTLLNGNNGWGINAQADYLRLVGGGIGQVQLQFSTDAGLSRQGAGVLDLGNGTYQDQTGTLILNKVIATSTSVTNASSTSETTTNFYLTGATTGCATFTGQILSSTGVACGSGGGSGNTAFLFGSGLIYNATSTDSVLIGTSTPTTSQFFIQGSGTKTALSVASSSGTTLLSVSDVPATTAGILLNVASSSATTMLGVDGYGRVQVYGLVYGSGSTPTVATSTGAGTAGTASITGTNTDFEVTVNALTAPATSATIVTVTMANAVVAPNKLICIPWPSVSASTLLNGTTQVTIGSTASTVTLTSGTAALTTGTTYKWMVRCGGY